MVVHHTLDIVTGHAPKRTEVLVHLCVMCVDVCVWAGDVWMCVSGDVSVGGRCVDVCEWGCECGWEMCGCK